MAPRIKPSDWVKAFVLKKVLSPRIPVPKLPLSRHGLVEPETVKVATRHGDIRCYIYRAHPEAPLAADGNPPVYVNIHGGGFVLTNPRQDDHLVSYLATEVGVTVVSIDYSTAPQVRFPVAEEQCFDVLTWVARAGETMGWDDTRIVIGGGSAGAKLTLSTLRLAHLAGGPTVDAAVVIVPFVDATLPPDSYRSALPKPVINAAAMRIFLGTYFVDTSRRAEPLASPAYDQEAAAYLPPLLVLGGGDDTLAPQGRAFVERLTAGGATVTYREFEGQDHTFIGLDSTPEAVMQESVQLIGDHVLQHLQPFGHDTSN